MRTAGSGEDPARLPVPVLAYVGDAVFELYARTRALRELWGARGEGQRAMALPAPPVRRLHARVVPLTRASGQARLLELVWPRLTPDEQDVARRARNRHPRRRPVGTGPGEYRNSTGFEALVGFLYLSGRQGRLEELLESAVAALEEGACAGHGPG